MHTHKHAHNPHGRSQSRVRMWLLQRVTLEYNVHPPLQHVPRVSGVTRRVYAMCAHQDPSKIMINPDEHGCAWRSKQGAKLRLRGWPGPALAPNLRPLNFCHEQVDKTSCVFTAGPYQRGRGTKMVFVAGFCARKVWHWLF